LGASFLLAAALFTLHHLGVISGALAPPPGFEPAWVIRNLDVPQYLTWLQASRDHLLIPDYHAPWRTEPALFEPLFWVAARLPLRPLAAYYTFHFSLYFAASFVLLYAVSVFCPGRDGWFALAAAACAVPFRLYGWLFASAFSSIKWQVLFAAGLIDYGYDTADGLFRGGLSNSPTLTAGTMFVLLAMALLVRYLETPSPGYLASLCGVTLLSALLHPFEVFLIVPAAAVPMLVRGRFMAWMAVSISGLLGMAPYLALSVRSAWLRDAGELIHSSFHPFWVLADFGPPCVLAVYLLLIRFRMPDTRDTVLKSWFLTAPVMLLVPGVPFSLHLLNGFAFCVGFLLVRRIACDRQIRPLLARHRRATYGVLAAMIAVSAAAVFVFYAQVWRDGRRAEPVWLLSSVRPVAEGALLDWLGEHAPSDALVLSPPDLAPWVATIPRTSFASHDFFSITYSQQRELAEQFLRGDPSLDDLVAAYGVRFVVVPKASAANTRMPGSAWRKDIGAWRIYEFPEAKMKPYPGIEVLSPGAPHSLRLRVLEWLGRGKPSG
jgi:hypothetical protein